MISPEILRRYPFFAGLNYHQIEALAKVADEIRAEPGFFFFREGEKIYEIFLLREGAVEILIELPDQEKSASVANQLTGDFLSHRAVVSTVGSGDVFGWSGLISPHITSAGARAITPCTVVAFDCERLREQFESDPMFGCILIEKVAQVMASRLSDLRIESLYQKPVD
ncbi:MAG: Crp/Fnr family transcriptional regulator [Anaerolineales bacterium]|nr:Crp/Fnr family transcriptional regulator [Anaerolineales bacterium]